MRCSQCGARHNGTYGSRCEDCWADAQVGDDRPQGTPYLSGLGEWRPRRTVLPSNPDLFSLVMGGVVAVL